MGYARMLDVKQHADTLPGNMRVCTGGNSCTCLQDFDCCMPRDVFDLTYVQGRMKLHALCQYPFVHASVNASVSAHMIERWHARFWLRRMLAACGRSLTLFLLPMFSGFTRPG